jgi:5-enolpyruvylshikimate-3-phosphate synthase
VMVECLQDLGYMVNVDPDPAETCNRTITVYGKSGKVPRGGTLDQPMELFVGNAGTAARFLAAMVCLGEGVYRLHGVPRMHERPQAALFKALRELGYRIESPNDKLPALIFGGGPKEGASCKVSIGESSQFASALLLAGRTGKWSVRITGENAEESPYVHMTAEMIKVFPHHGGKFQIEPDASSGSYFLAVNFLNYNLTRRFNLRNGRADVDPYLPPKEFELRSQPVALDKWEKSWLYIPQWPYDVAIEGKQFWVTERSCVRVAFWPVNEWQIDVQFYAKVAGVWLVARATKSKNRKEAQETMISKMLPLKLSRTDDLGDSIMTVIALAPGVSIPMTFTDLGRLRVQESERVVALRTELTKCGAKVIEEDDTLTVFPSQLHGAEIETYNDHRMAMCFGVLGLKVPGMKIRNPACVKKTFPNFWQKLAARPPRGLGAKILDAHTGRELSHEELFAE